MSSILKALKKVEHDKIICRPDQLGIDSRILQDGSSNRFSRTAVSLIALALFVCGSGATYFYMKHDAADVVVSQTITSRTEPNRQQPPVSPVIPTVLKSGTQRTTTPPLLSPKAPPVFGAQIRLPNDPAKSPRPPQPGKRVEIAPIPESRPVSLQVVPTSTVTRPALTVNGIAYQDGGSDNLAVINGITVSSGAVIEGVRVEDIQKDRVRFSHGGEKFEIILNKSNR